MSALEDTRLDADAELLALALHVPRGAAREPDDTRARILHEAIQLFGAHGYAGTSMRDIAQAVGIRPASIYAHFASKEQVLVEALTGTLDAFHAFLLEAVEPGLPARDQLERLVRQHVRWQVRFRRLAGSWDVLWDMEATAGNLGPDAVEELHGRRARYHRVLGALVAETCPGPDAARRTAAVLVLCDRSPTWAQAGGAAVDDDGLVDAAWETIAGLLA